LCQVASAHEPLGSRRPTTRFFGPGIFWARAPRIPKDLAAAAYLADERDGLARVCAGDLLEGCCRAGDDLLPYLAVCDSLSEVLLDHPGMEAFGCPLSHGRTVPSCWPMPTSASSGIAETSRAITAASGPAVCRAGSGDTAGDVLGLAMTQASLPDAIAKDQSRRSAPACFPELIHRF
jgi:hypothetical protein